MCLCFNNMDISSLQVYELQIPSRTRAFFGTYMHCGFKGPMIPGRVENRLHQRLCKHAARESEHPPDFVKLNGIRAEIKIVTLEA